MIQPATQAELRHVLAGLRDEDVFDPLKVAGLSLDINFRNNQALVVTSSPDIDAVSDPVSSYYFEQSTASKKPEIVTVGGRKYARFSTDDNLDELTHVAYEFRFHTKGMISFAFIPRLLSTSPILSAGDADNVRYWSAKIAVVGGTSMRLSFAMKYSGTNTDQVYGDTELDVDEPVVCTVISEGAGTPYKLRVNGVLQTNTVASGGDNGKWFANTSPALYSYIDTMCIGSVPISNGHAGYAEGDIDRILYYGNVTVSDADIAYVERGLAAEIGATLA